MFIGLLFSIYGTFHQARRVHPLLGINHKVISRVKYVAEKIVMGMVMGMGKYLWGWGRDGKNFTGMGLIFLLCHSLFHCH